MIPLRHKLKYMVGPHFDYMAHKRDGVTVAHGFCLFVGFYWFGFTVFRRWPLDFTDGYASGFAISTKPSPSLREGDLMWLRNKKYLRYCTPEDFQNATQVQTANRKYER